MSSASKELIPLLMLVPYFAPQTHAAMFRAHKLAKYLPQFGYRPIIVTADINYLYNEDPRLLDELPACVEVHRARHVEPTVRGLRMALGGRDRTFAALKHQGAYDQTRVSPASASTPVASRKWRWSMAEAVRIVGEWPDRYWTWSISARSLCRRLVREHNIRLLYTSAVPVSPLRTALQLKREFNMQWVADFRDPVGYGKKHSAVGMIASDIEHRILAESMQKADMVTGLASAYGGIFFDLFGLPEDRYRFIPTGLDESYLEDPREALQQSSSFVHIGEVMPNQSRHAFAVLARAFAMQPGAMSKFRLEFIGRREINQPRVEAITSTLPAWPYVTEFIDHLPQREVYARIRAATACLLIPGRHRYWWTNFAKMVDYIALGQPVIADVPVISEARSELKRAGTGFFLGGEDIDRDAEALLEWLGAGADVAPNGYGARYSSGRQAGDFAEIFDRLLERDGVR